ncbi:hypothetical protein DFJ63DRAFT_310822 [Scheffersomyces coipomensis]|uniref:uncharacterized protein n=1 Tax=Scheffersomyces coipomensis TaxID=1788519 RepID=UPI00315D2FC1
MSGTTAASHAAALAAFKASSNKDPPKKPNTMASLSAATSMLGHSQPQQPSVLRTTSRNARGSIPKLTIPDINPQKVLRSPLTSPRTPEYVQKSRMGSVDTQSSSDIESLNSSFDYFSLPKSSSSRKEKVNNVKPQDMINNVKRSIEERSTAKDASQRRISAIYEPKAMIKNVKDAISAKSTKNPLISSPSSDSVYKHNSAIHEVRERIESKRISTPVLKDDSMDAARTTYGSPIYQEDWNNSSASVSTSVSDLEIQDSTPIVESDNADSTLENETIHKEETLQQPQQPPIMIPPSPSAFARTLAVGSVDSLSNSLPSPRLIAVNSQNTDIGSVEEVNKPKLKRKPPPGISVDDLAPTSSYNDNESENVYSNPSSTTSYNVMYNVSSSDWTDGESYHVETPGREGIYSNTSARTPIEQPRPSTNTVYKMVANDSRVTIGDSGAESDYDYGKLSHQNQPVRMKSTMRKRDKRKDRKLIFNENKPWKNHQALTIITDQERKRYEGLWASNRGSYMNAVVTPMVGINPTDIKSSESKDDSIIASGAISLTAARLSSKSDSLSTTEDLHGLEVSDPNQLIHGLVVKRIWSRSRLPDETLKEIWDLVDFRKDGTLNKPEFLVGMWLVDQCLYGRKLPKRVEDLVWESLGNIGINVVIKRKGKR